MYKNLKFFFCFSYISMFIRMRKSTASSKKEDVTIQIGIQQGLSPLLLAKKRDGLKRSLKRRS